MVGLDRKKRKKMSSPPKKNAIKSSKIRVKYKPLPSQANFHADLKAKLKILLGGVGSGKTKGGAAEAIKKALRNPAVDGMIIAPYYKVLHRVTLRAFLELLPKDLILEHNKGQNFIELINGSRVYYGSADNPASLEGSNLGWAWGDELRYWKREAFEVLIARVRQPCEDSQVFFTTTPDMGWLYDVFGTEAQQKNPTIREFRISTEENPYLPKDFCTTLKNNYDERLYRAYVKGEWVRLQGSVFFFEDKHIEIDLEDQSRGGVVDIAIDTGYRRSAVLFIQKHDFCTRHNKRDCVHVLAEVMADDTPTIDLVPKIKEMLYRNRWKVGTIYIDPAANANSITVGFSDVDVLEKEGWDVRFTYDPNKRRILTGIRLMQSKLITHSVYFSPLLREKRGIINAIKNAAYPERGQSEEPIKDGVYDHARDALRYYLINTCELPLGDAVMGVNFG